MKLKTNTQFSIIPLFSALAIISIGLVVFNFERDQRTKLNTFKERELSKVNLITENLLNLTTNHSRFIKLLSMSRDKSATEEEVYEKGQQAIDTIRDSTKKIQEIRASFSFNDKELKLYEQTIDHLEKYQKATTSAIEMVSAHISLGLKFMLISNREFAEFSNYIIELLGQSQSKTQNTLEDFLASSRKVVTTFIYIFIISTLLFFILSYITVKKFTLPIIEISSLVGQVNKGSDYSLRYQKSVKNIEVDQLKAGLNAFLAKIESNRAEIRRYNNELEKLVEERSIQLEEARAETIQASKLASLGEMAGGIAHEINNPLAIISSSTGLLLKKMEKNKLDESFILKITDRIDNTVARITKIVEGLRIVSRDSDDDSYEATSILDIVGDSTGLCAEKFKANGVDLQVHSNSISNKDLIFCNQVQISQVFLNLLGNAFDALVDPQKKQNEMPEKWVKIEFETGQNTLTIKITDSGSGIPTDIQEKMFNPFFTSKEIGKGTGLGLSISRKIIEKHNGKIKIDNDNPNTCFVIEFPLHDEANMKKVSGA